MPYMSYKNVLIHLIGYVLGAWHTAILWQSLLTWLTASDEIRVFTFDIHFICSEYGIKHNLQKMKFLYLRLAFFLLVWNIDWNVIRE
jgi:hypothetical protein